jgi:homoserine kinase
MLNEVKVFVPASVSNVGCGFDTFGFAIEKLGDEITLRKTEGNDLVIKSISGDNGKLPKDIRLNTVGAPLMTMMLEHNITCGVELEINKYMPISSGLGSSAACAVASAYAGNILFELNLSEDKILDYALQGEKIASGGIHADNVAPALFGGFILIRSYNPIDIIKLPAPENLYCVIIYTDIEISTKDARRVLPECVPLKDAVKHWGNSAALTAGLFKNDLKLIGRAVEDFIVEPVRASLIPNYYKIKEIAYKNGSLACNISGSGPSIFAFAESEELADKIKYATNEFMVKCGNKFDIFVSKVNANGALLIDKK